ncbi:MAG: DUF6499 domain-containing protein, partial [Bradyrhizobium sp.]|nr:DUF6499 domain-containing protein [Bradyrhizobium sp.]
MSEFDWRSPKAYANIHRADRPGFAWESVRRSPNYCTEFSAIVHLDRSAPANFRKH